MKINHRKIYLKLHKQMLIMNICRVEQHEFTNCCFRDWFGASLTASPDIGLKSVPITCFRWSTTRRHSIIYFFAANSKAPTSEKLTRFLTFYTELLGGKFSASITSGWWKHVNSESLFQRTAVSLQWCKEYAIVVKLPQNVANVFLWFYLLLLFYHVY